MLCTVQAPIVLKEKKLLFNCLRISLLFCFPSCFLSVDCRLFFLSLCGLHGMVFCRLALKVVVCVFRSRWVCLTCCNLQAVFAVCFFYWIWEQVWVVGLCLLFLVAKVGVLSCCVNLVGWAWREGCEEKKKKRCELLLYVTVVHFRSVVGWGVFSSQRGPCKNVIQAM
jgi:hypothetical protein